MNNSTEQSSEKIVSTFILDDSDNLSIILTEPEINPTSNALEIEDYDIQIDDSSLYSGNQININKRQKLLKINSVAPLKNTSSNNEGDKVRQQFLNLFHRDQQLPLAAILDFVSLMPPSWDLSAKRNINLSIGLETQYILDGIHTLLNLIKNTKQHQGININLFTDIEDSIDILLPLCQKKDCQFINNLKPELTKLICVKGAQFKPILQNVLLNALLYNTTNSNIYINQKEVNANNIRIQITGAGLNPETNIESIQPFNLISANTYVLEGSGIGLVIVNKLIEFIGGGFSVASDQNQRNCFDMVLPVKDYIPDSSFDRIPQYLDTLSKSGIHNILYIEDNELHIQLVANIFEKLPGITFTSANSSAIGIDLAISTKPDLILLDIRLPDMNGYEVFSVLRNTPETCAIPVIALSAAAMPHEISKAMSLGFTHYLTKPFQIGELTSKVLDELIKSAQSEASRIDP